MSLRKSTIKEDKNTGFSDKADWIGGRLINKDGNANVIKTGTPFLERISLYHSMLKMSRWQFVGIIFIAFLLINLVFTILYYLIGVHHINGIHATRTLEKFSKVYFFSIQTFTTVGYGHISPEGFLTSLLSSIQAFSGLLFFAMATGLLYGRFSKPNAFLSFSENAIIAPYQDINALMFRTVPFKNHHLTEAEVKLSLALWQDVNGAKKMHFYNLKTEIEKINTLSLSWTIVHPLNEESPLFGFKEEDFTATRMELIVFVKAFDEMYSNTVVARTSYTFNELIIGAKFKPMYHRSAQKNTTTIELDKINEIENVTLNEWSL